MILIGITGRAGSGKDTAADYLCRTHFFTKQSCAGPLKSALSTMGFPEPADRAKKEEKIEGFDFTWREAAQKLGTEFGRALDEDIWVKILRRQLEAVQGLEEDTGMQARYVISDIRFENEAAMIRELGGAIIHLSGRAVDLGTNSGHASEAGIAFDARDWMIDNSQTLSDLHISLEFVVGSMTNG